MPMKLITARDTGDEYVFRVHLDEARRRGDEPDPAWVEEFHFGKGPPEGRMPAQYLADCKREARLLCQAALDRRTAARPGTKLAGEGEEF